MEKKFTVYVIMGVSGCGKSTIGQLLADKLKLPFHDGDDFHPPSNIKKMQAGIPLNDDDRAPWLQKLNHHIKAWNEEKGAVLACSALKESYRKILSDQTTVTFVHLHSSKENILNRINNREGHFMPASLLDSQFKTLEEPMDAIRIEASQPTEMIIELIVNEIKQEL